MALRGEQVSNRALQEILLHISSQFEVGRNPERKVDDRLVEEWGSWLDPERSAQVVQLGQKARDTVRTEGMHSEIADRFTESIADVSLDARGLPFVDELLNFFSDQSRGMMKGDVYLGSTEVLESLFGKLKSMEQDQTAFGFTSLILAAVAQIGPSPVELIEAAIQAVTSADIKAWANTEIGHSVQSQRKKIRQAAAEIRQKMNQKVA